MSKIKRVLAGLLFLAAINGWAQLSPSSGMERIADSTTVFSSTLSEGGLFIVLETDNIYLTLKAIESTAKFNDLVDGVDYRLVSTHDLVTLATSATDGGLSLINQEIGFRAATNAQTGYATASQITDLEANTAARHDAITLTGTGDYLTLAGQDLTKSLIDTLGTDIERSKFITFIGNHSTGGGGIGGSGTATYIPKFTDATTLANSNLTDNGSLISLLSNIEVTGHISQTGTGNSVFLGEFAGINDDLTNNQNVFIGTFAGTANTIGSSNTSIGERSFFSNVDGSFNMAIGRRSLYLNTSGDFNAAIGYASLYENTIGSNNVALGYEAGRYINAGTANQTSIRSVYLGVDSRASASGNANEIVIGYIARGAGSNSVVLGNDDITKTLLKGSVGVGTANPTGYLHIRPGTAAAGTAPLKFTSGTNLTTPEAGAMEFDGNGLYFTKVATRDTVAFLSDITGGGSGTVTSVGFGDGTGFTISGSPITTSGSFTFAQDFSEFTDITESTGIKFVVTDPLEKEIAISDVDLSDFNNDAGFITGNETITLSGDVTGSGATAITATVVDDSHNHIISNVDNLQTSLDGKVNDTGDETIAGIKTFSSFPITPSSAPTTDYQVSNKKYVDDNFAGAGSWVLDNDTLSTGNYILSINETAPDADKGGLTLNQGTGVSNILTFKQSNISHGITSIAETDTYYFAKQFSAGTGGVHKVGITEGNIANLIEGIVTTADNTTTTGSTASVIVLGNKADGVAKQALAADENVFAVQNGGGVTHIFKGDGGIRTTGGNVGINEAAPDVDAGGLTLNQGADDGKISTWKSTDVAHGITSFAETDTYFYGRKYGVNSGGVRFYGLTEDVVGLSITGFGTNSSTLSTTGAPGAVIIDAAKKSGTSVTSFADADNLMVISNNNSARVIFKGDGGIVTTGGEVIADNLVTYEKVSLNSAQVNNLGVQTTLIAAPGAGKAIQLVSVLIKINVTTQLEVGTQTLDVNLGTVHDLYYLDNASVETATTKLWIPSQDVTTNSVIADNQALRVVLSSGANPSSGSATMDFHIAYKIIDY